MRKIKIKMIGSGTQDDPYRVDLPTWQCVTFDTDRGIKPSQARAIVEVPATYINEKGELDRKYIKATYKGSKWEKHIDEVDDPEEVLPDEAPKPS
jgi:N12 class adenine-specific DNA methylase